MKRKGLVAVLTVAALALWAMVTLGAGGAAASPAIGVKTKTISVARAGVLRPGMRLTLPRKYHSLRITHYQWLRCNRRGVGCRKIHGATRRSYVVRMADIGHTIRAQVGQSSVTALTAPTPTVGRPAPVNTAIPTISDGGQGGGSMSGPIVGDILTGTNGTWQHAVRFTYQWNDCDSTGANCVAIAGATTQSYTLLDADVGHTIVFAVTAYNFESVGQGNVLPTGEVGSTDWTGGKAPSGGSHTGISVITMVDGATFLVAHAIAEVQRKRDVHAAPITHPSWVAFDQPGVAVPVVLDAGRIATVAPLAPLPPLNLACKDSINTFESTQVIKAPRFTTLGDSATTSESVQAVRRQPIYDDFNRSDGSLGSLWTAGSEGEPQIISGAFTGAGHLQSRSAVRTGEVYPGDHSSQIEVTSIPLPPSAWVAATVRSDLACQNLYAALYFNTGTSYQVSLWVRVAGTYTQIDGLQDPVSPGPTGWTLNGPLNAGDKVRLAAVGSTILVYLNDLRIIKVTDTTIAASGAPGIATFETSVADNWQSDLLGALAEPVAPIQVFTGSPPNSPNNGGNHGIRVLVPDAVTSNLPHNFLYVLPVDPDGIYNYGNAMDVMYGLNVHNRYNVTIVEPNFAIGSWYADHTSTTSLKHETYMVNDFAPWVTSTWSRSGKEEHWLMGFSRSGFGGLGLLQKHPSVFTRGAFWDWPFDMNTSNYSNYGGGPGVYGSDANFVNNYQMTPAYVAAHTTGFTAINRIWIGLHEAFQTDVNDADVSFTSNGILHTTDSDIFRAHAWGSGWVEHALIELSYRSGPVNGPPTLLTAPTVNGGLSQGATIQCSTGTWSNVPAQFAYQWQSDSSGSYVDIAVTVNKYVTQASDVGHNLRCHVLATNILGSTSATSTVFGPVAPVISDNFNRADGGLGANWTSFATPIVIDTLQVRGNTLTAFGGLSGTWRSGEVYPGDHFSQIESTGVDLGIKDWIGPAIRVDPITNNLYLAIYFRDGDGNYFLQLYSYVSSAFTLLAPAVFLGTSPLVAGTKLQLGAEGTLVTLYKDGTVVIQLNDNSVPSGGAPGIMSAGDLAFADNWVGGSSQTV